MKRSRSPSENSKPIQLLLQAPDGVVPYLTPVLLRKYFPSPQPHLLLGVSVQDTCLMPLYPTPESTKPKGYEFRSRPSPAYIKDSYEVVTVSSFDLLQDALKHKQTQVQANNKGVSVWSPQGRQVLTNEAYMKVASEQGNTVVALYDMSAPSQSKSRTEQAVKRNEEWLRQILSDAPPKKSVWAPISLTMKPVTVPESNDSITGYAVVGIEQEGAEIEEIQKLISPDKTMAVLSVTSMENLLQCLEHGVDVIGTNLPTKWSSTHKAFCVPLAEGKKKGKSESSATAVLLDLTDKKYAKDGAPLVANCTCLTCSHYTRAYIHHLHQANELLAQVLLMGHNLHHFLRFVKCATEARDKGELEAFLESCK
jgi:tRNA-guanine family transglycosylase